MNAKKVELKKEIDSLLYRRLMDQFFRRNEWHYETSITSVKVFQQKFKQKDAVVIEIESHRPGLLIGKGGEFIDGLIKFIKEETKENIHLALKECELWLGLYK